MPDNVHLAHLFAEIMNGDDAGRFAELVVPDYVNHNPQVPPGRDGLIGFMGHLLETLTERRVTVEDAFAAGDRVVGRYTYRARHTGPFLGIPATGRVVTMRSIDIWRVQGGRFAEHWDELNLLDVFAQIGAVQLPAGLG